MNSQMPPRLPHLRIHDLLPPHTISIAIPYELCDCLLMGKTDVWQGTLALMVLKTLETLGPQHGYGIARRIEQTSGDRLALNYGTLYPALLKLEQEGYIASEWGVSEKTTARRSFTR